jgi:hypothetical protein
MKMLVALLGLALVFVSPAARASEPVDMLLVLAADVSRSVTDPKFRLQREGAAAAITHPDVVRAITSGPNRRIAVCFVEWASANMQKVVIDWMVIGDGDSARRFGDRLVETPRSFAGSTSISAAIDFAVGQFERAPFVSDRRVIDVSGDGNNIGGRPVTDARDDAVAKNVVDQRAGDPDPDRGGVPARAHQPTGWVGEILSGERHRRTRSLHDRRRKPRCFRAFPDKETDPGDRRSAAQRRGGRRLTTQPSRPTP